MIALIDGRLYTGHALDRMQRSGIYPSTVENTIAYGIPKAGNTPLTTRYYNPINNVSAIIANEGGRVITVGYGKDR